MLHINVSVCETQSLFLLSPPTSGEMINQLGGYFCFLILLCKTAQLLQNVLLNAIYMNIYIGGKMYVRASCLDKLSDFSNTWIA